MIIIDNKIALRKPISTDLSDLMAVKNNTEASLLLGGNKQIYSETDILEWINFHSNSQNELFYVIYDIELNAVVGHVALYNIDTVIRKAEFGILIGSNSCRGRGYGSMCLDYMLRTGFCELKLNRIELSLLSENFAALKLYEKFDFKIEGVQKDAQFKNGRYYDVILMALLKRDYDL